ncbi:hypothetical protein [Allorhizobium taibaishanense]|uniref:TnsA endonuclease N-terminal domain-containing protein n=1 Tax=Allorhizobium taibaishanense TaxID=887144 RepID=A0A7W6HSQ4_9HYPH|nr:hypothetical protein [Allorhizobium taibaishanense]MBB4010261.1 hypothetical protein [Allorhizobium taibaishanense]
MRHTHKIAKHLYLKRAGLRELSFPNGSVSSVDQSPLPAASISYLAVTSGSMAAKPRSAWHEPDHGLALRTPALKQAKTTRGHTFYRDTVIYHESGLEHRVSVVLQTYRGLARLISQYPKVEWVDEDGVAHHHTCDYFIELADGTRVAIVVKYERKREEMLDLIERICNNGITGIAKGGKRTVGVADAVVLVTNAQATQEAFENAYFLLSSRAHHDQAECAALYDIVQQLPGTFRFGQLLLNCWPRAKRRTAIWRLLDLGLIEPVNPGLIDELAWLRAA